MPRDAGSWVAVALVAVLAHATALDGEYTYDDHAVVDANPRLVVKGPRDLVPLLASNYWGAEGERSGERLFRPVPLATFALERAVVGAMRSRASRAVNVLVHAAAALLLLALARAWTGDRRAALIAALVFAAHPRHAEAVAGAVGRAELLALACGLASLIFIERRRPLAAALFFFLALGSKESAIAILPIALLRIGLSRARREEPRPAVVEALALSGALGAYLVVRALAIGALVPQAGARTLGDMPLAGRAVVALAVLRDAWAALILPRDATSAHYPLPDRGAAGVAIAAGVQLALLALAVRLATRGAAGRGGRRAGAAALAIAGVELALLPVSNIVPIGVVFAERLLYAPSAWAAVVLGVGLASGWDEVARRVDGGRTVARVALAVAVGACAHRSARADLAWRDDLTLWTASVARYPDEPRAHLALGETLLQVGNARAAVPHLARAVQDWDDSQPLRAKALIRLAQAIRGAKGNPADAERALAEALARAPTNGAVLTAAARIRLEDGRWSEALALARRAKELSPELYDARVLAGAALSNGGEPRAAIEELDAAIPLVAAPAEALWNRAEARWKLGEREPALDDYRRAAALIPPLVPPYARAVLVLRLAEAGHAVEARALLAEATELGPSDRERIEALLRGRP